MKTETLKSPYPYFGGKSKIAGAVWERRQRGPAGFDGQGLGEKNENRRRERAWFSPACLPAVQVSLFTGGAT